jgi:tRNA 2-thiouridine synthesizing protein C
MSDPAKRFLFIVRGPPLAGALAREALDGILTVAAFEQFVRVLFVDDGVFQLLARPVDPAGVSGETTPALEVLAFYEVQDVWVERESLLARGIGADDLAIAAELIARDRIPALLAEQQIVVVC